MRTESGFNFAVRTAIKLVVDELALTVKLAVAFPGRIVTEEGTDSDLLLADKYTLMPFPRLDAGSLRVTIQTLLSPPGNTTSEQLSDFRRPEGTTRGIERVTERSGREAVMVAVAVVVTFPAITAKLTVLAPAGTVKFAGAVSWAWFEERVTRRPPAGAGPFKLTVQMPEP